MAKKRSKLHILKTAAQYGIHIWAILLIANAALAYAFYFSAQESKNDHTMTNILSLASDPSPTPIPDLLAQQETPKEPEGPVIDLTFTVPGIGSGGGTLTPARLKRNVTVYLYGPDANSLNPSVKPSYVIKGSANFDTNSLSGTYTSFINHFFDLGSNVKDGQYQIIFRTDESLRTIIRKSPEDIGGQVFTIHKDADPLIIPPQTVLMGDTLPKDGDNLIDISDYNAFINCFGDRSKSKSCQDSNFGDFDDNGTIDGVDYNILLHSFSSLLSQGQPIPKVTLSPTGPSRVSKLSDLTTPTPKTKPKVSPTAAVVQTSNSGGNIVGGILFFLFFMVLGAIGFFLYKKNEHVRDLIQSLIELLPSALSSKLGGTPQEEEPTPSETASPSNQQQEVPPSQPAEAAPTVAETPTAPSPTPPVDPAEKDYFVKKVEMDTARGGTKLTLTDDNGSIEAHYAGATQVPEGFVKVKGTMKNENGNTYLEISEITPEG